MHGIDQCIELREWVLDRSGVIPGRYTDTVGVFDGMRGMRVFTPSPGVVSMLAWRIETTKVGDDVLNYEQSLGIAGLIWICCLPAILWSGFVSYRAEYPRSLVRTHYPVAIAGGLLIIGSELRSTISMILSAGVLVLGSIWTVAAARRFKNGSV